ncbi:hypothetical protein FRC03_006033 [Tulasnella sp. 419]|nr:hypothetical protein FRC03_006033 [Tulasnella sp. 419]
MGTIDDLLILPCYVFSQLRGTKGSYTPKKILDRDVSPIEFPFIAVPINSNGDHWILAIIAYIGDLRLSSNNPRTTILILDSLNGSPKHHAEDVMWLKVLIKTWFAGVRDVPIAEMSKVPVHHPHVLRQPNFVDCGFYPAHFLSVFMKDPTRYLKHCTGEAVIEGELSKIWEGSHLGEHRERFRNYISGKIELFTKVQAWYGSQLVHEAGSHSAAMSQRKTSQKSKRLLQDENASPFPK